MNQTIYHVALTLTEDMLGTVPKDKEVYASYIASKTEQDTNDELETVPDSSLEEKGWTGFHELNGCPLLYDYAIKGMLKSACGALRRVSGTKSSKLTAYKKIIDGLVFPQQRRILLRLPEGAELGVLERPLRASTPQGERVALARSDTAPAGTKIEFDLLVLGDKVVTKGHVEEWLGYGSLCGLGQWRSGGWGRFTYELSVKA